MLIYFVHVIKLFTSFKKEAGTEADLYMAIVCDLLFLL